VLEVHAKMMEAEKNRDADKFFSFIPDFEGGAIIQDGTLFRNRQEALDTVKMAFQQLSKIDRKYDQMYVTVIAPEVALVTGTGTLTAATPDGKSLSGPFAVSMVFAVREGQWKLVQGHYSMPSPR
jgi:uncharacterized protein (TIGR02246 family)